MKKCEDVQERLDEYISNDISDSERIEIQNHLDECPRCAAEVRQWTRLVATAAMTWEACL